jgi:hypothetical protein
VKTIFTFLGRLIGKMLLLLIVAAPVWGVVWLAWDVRGWSYEKSRDVHFMWDMNNAQSWSTRILDGEHPDAPNNAKRGAVTLPALLRNIRDLYGAVARARTDAEYELDYVPGKALMMTLWWRHIYATYPDADHFLHEYADPMLRFNFVLEVLASAGMFLLVRQWISAGDAVRRGKMPDEVSERGTFLGIIAALLLLFNPAVILEAHGWPQWDSWLIPFYVWAIYFITVNRWWCAGATLALGAMFKGQLMIVAPFVLLLALFLGRLGAMLRAFCGGATVFAAVATAWLISGHAALVYVVAIVVAAGAAVAAAYLRPRWARLALAVLVLLLCVTPIWTVSDWWHVVLWGAMGVVLVGVALLAPPRWVWFYAIGAIAAAVFIAGYLFGGDFTWWTVGFLYGTRHYHAMTMGPSVNLARLLHDIVHMDLETPMFPSPGFRIWPTSWMVPSIDWDTNLFLRTLFFVSLVLCAIGSAIHFRRRDARFLLAAMSPWLMFFALLPQMHERYLIWFAGLSAALVAVDFGLMVLGLILSVINMGQIFFVMMANSPHNPYPRLIYYETRLERIEIGIVLLAAAVCLYLTILPRRMRDDRGRRVVLPAGGRRWKLRWPSKKRDKALAAIPLD